MRLDKEEVISMLAEHSEKIRNLEMWQEKQNGSLQRVEGRVEKIEGKVDKIYAWLIGVMGGVITSLFLLITQILR